MSTRIEREELYPADLVPAIVALAWEGFQKGRKTEAIGVDGFPVLKEDPAKEIHLLLNDFIQEGADFKPSWEMKADKLPSWKKVLAGDARQRGRMFLAAAARVAWFWKYAAKWSKDWNSWVYEDKGFRRPLGHGRLVVQDLLDSFGSTNRFVRSERHDRRLLCPDLAANRRLQTNTMACEGGEDVGVTFFAE